MQVGKLVEINPRSLTDASGKIEQLAEEFHDTEKVPHLYADNVVRDLPGCPIGAALATADQTSIDAKNVLSVRWRWIAHQLLNTAQHYKDNDSDLARSLKDMGDLHTGTIE